MLIVNQKIMLLGVGAALALLKMKTANVFHVRLIRILFEKKKIQKTKSTLVSTSIYSTITECNDYFCGQGAVCIVTREGPTCKCPPGLLGNPFPGGVCVTDQCSSSSPCADSQRCIGGRCKHRCENVVCGVGATCEQSSGRCVCEPNFVGNPDFLCMPRTLHIRYVLLE